MYARAEELIKKLEAGEDIDKLNYVDEEIFAHDDTVKSVKATNSLDEEKDFDVTPLTQDILGNIPHCKYNITLHTLPPAFLFSIKRA